MEKIEELAEIYKALSETNRLRILKILIDNDNKPLCVNALSMRLNITTSAVSQHLRILKQIRFVQSNKYGLYVHYEINFETVKKYKDCVKEVLGEGF